MNFLERVILNYFLAWRQMFNYHDKTSRIPFWHFYCLDGVIVTLIFINSSNAIIGEPNDFYSVNSGIEFGYLYTLPSLLTFIALAIRRLRDIGKENPLLWLIFAFIPFFNLYLFSQPSSNK
tara:strand:+ start:345 stop:707 length:363 start_codon:yes stop_codon:yes gene_type:complete